MRAAALIFSVLFHPLLMASYGTSILLFGLTDSVYDYLTPLELKWRIVLLVFTMTFLLPVLNIWLLYKMNRISSFLLSERTQRGYPYVLTALFYFGLVYLLWDINIWNTLKLFFFGGGLAILLTALINRWMKISAHMVGLGGLFGVLIAVSSLLRLDLILYYIVVVLIAGLVGSSRSYLGEHRLRELGAGFLLGVLVQSALFFTLRWFSFHYLL